MADGRRDVNWGTDLDRSADDEHDGHDGHDDDDGDDGDDGHHLLICSEFCITQWFCSIIIDIYHNIFSSFSLSILMKLIIDVDDIPPVMMLRE